MQTTRKPVSGPVRRIVIALDRAILWFSRHWLAIFNTLAGLYIGLPLLAPLLADWGLDGVAHAVYFAYRFVCHQQPERSFFVFGKQMAFCQRDVAIYASVWLAGLAYAVTGRRWRPLSWLGAALMVLPALIDGSIQMVTPYQSNWPLRIATGIPVGIAGVWFLYPRAQQALEAIQRQETRQLERAALRDKGIEACPDSCND